MSILAVYQCKPSKNVFVLSTLHRIVAIGNEPKKVPDTVHYSNSRKYGVDIVDQTARKYSTKAGSHQWPVHVFLQHAGSGCHKCINTIQRSHGNIIRRDFILQIEVELQQHYKQRGNNHPSRENEESDYDFEAATISKKRNNCTRSRNVNVTKLWSMSQMRAGCLWEMHKQGI